MKTYMVAIALFIGISIFSCKSKSVATNSENIPQQFNDTVKIANEELEYEVIIIDGGFNSWLYSNARPRGFYSQTFLETRNIPWVLEWNNRTIAPRSNKDRDLFLMQIDYQNGTNYGYEVNYLLYNYLVYFQLKNNIRLGGFTPRP